MKRIVIIDDCRLTLQIAEDMLAGAGYDVVAAQSGIVANQHIYRKPRPALILVDVEMPMLPGHRLVKLLKDEQCLQGIPVILMSQKEAAEMEEFCRVSGADGFIVKPLRKPALLQLLARFA